MVSDRNVEVRFDRGFLAWGVYNNGVLVNRYTFEMTARLVAGRLRDGVAA